MSALEATLQYGTIFAKGYLKTPYAIERYKPETLDDVVLACIYQ